MKEETNRRKLLKRIGTATAVVGGATVATPASAENDPTGKSWTKRDTVVKNKIGNYGSDCDAWPIELKSGLEVVQVNEVNDEKKIYFDVATTGLSAYSSKPNCYDSGFGATTYPDNWEDYLQGKNDFLDRCTLELEEYANTEYLNISVPVDDDQKKIGGSPATGSVSQETKNLGYSIVGLALGVAGGPVSSALGTGLGAIGIVRNAANMVAQDSTDYRYHTELKDDPEKLPNSVFGRFMISVDKGLSGSFKIRNTFGLESQWGNSPVGHEFTINVSHSYGGLYSDPGTFVSLYDSEVLR